MCTVVSERQVMVCDVGRDSVGDALARRLGGAARAETVPGQGTLFSCLDHRRVADFQAAVEQALGWVPSEGGFSPPD